MKKICFTFLLIFFAIPGNAQSDREEAAHMSALESRAKADKILASFDSLTSAKLLYSLDDQYYYVIIKDAPVYKEYYIETDSSGLIIQLRLLNQKKIKGKKQRKLAEQYRKLLYKGCPFELDQYHTLYVTKMPDAKYLSGGSSYFVVKDIDGKRYGEYRLSVITMPSLINSNLWSYLLRRLSEETTKNKNFP